MKNEHFFELPIDWNHLQGSSLSLALIQFAQQHQGPLLIVTPDNQSALQLEYELRFFAFSEFQNQILLFPDWEILPYDQFSPHPDIISQRLSVLYQLPQLQRGIAIVAINTLMQRVPAQDYVFQNSLMLKTKDVLDLTAFREKLAAAGYKNLNQVMEHGEFAIRGSIIDIYPMGSDLPFRIDLFDNEIESIRTFDPETQRSIDKIEEIQLLPAEEFSKKEKARATLFDYLNSQTSIFLLKDIQNISKHFWEEIQERYEQRRHDIELNLDEPEILFLPLAEIFEKIQSFSTTHIEQHDNSDLDVLIEHKLQNPLSKLENFLMQTSKRILFCAESAGRREVLLELLKTINLTPDVYNTWEGFIKSNSSIAITTAVIDRGFNLEKPPFVLITEPQLFGQQLVMQRRRRKDRPTDTSAIIRSLAELQIGAPVVHIEHGVGRYQGLQKITVNEQTDEYLVLEYAGGDKIYVPVASLHLINRYSGIDPEHAPIHKLGSDQWEKAKRKAAEKVSDVAAELLEIYAKRESKKGYAFKFDENAYQIFATAFPFEETPDQAQAIEQVIQDMRSDKVMDRLICGDVGFGKTEVAMRAAFVAINDGKQVAILVPTTLLAQQHYQSFRDRFADWPVKIELLSRFRTKKENQNTMTQLEEGKIDIVIGTHKLLQSDIKFKNLGLLIIDEEHRFGVKQKEQLKKMRAEIDILTLTATPIPRTLNFALSGIRDLSMIATPPAKRLSIKTFVHTRDKNLIREAILREILRGGQVYFVHNKIDTIEHVKEEVSIMIPEARPAIAHAQMRETELEKIMSDFYHQRFNVLICTTIIENGIDIPTANTIIIDRADHFGLAQLHQLRGRVGRSHHQAYAYLMTPPEEAMTPDSQKRLEAIASLEDLGAGFTLATHDLEIRGVGELLGEEQSGHIQTIGFNLYSELLGKAVKAIKDGKHFDINESLSEQTEINLQVTALIPDDYLPDVHLRLILYKRIANAKNNEELESLQVEMIDRFGLLPNPIKTLFQITELKLMSENMGIRKIEMTPQGGRVEFLATPRIDPEKIIRLIQLQSPSYKFDGPQRLRIQLKTENGYDRIKFIKSFLAELS